MAEQRHIGIFEGALPERLRGTPRATTNTNVSAGLVLSKPTRFAIACILVLAGFMFFFMARSAVTPTLNISTGRLHTDLTVPSLYFLLCLLAFFLGFRGLGKLIFGEPGRGASADAAQSNRSQSNQAEGS